MLPRLRSCYPDSVILLEYSITTAVTLKFSNMFPGTMGKIISERKCILLSRQILSSCERGFQNRKFNFHDKRALYSFELLQLLKISPTKTENWPVS
jgi:hypothetical protein